MFHLTTGPRQDSDNVPAHPSFFHPPSLSHLLSVTDCKLFGINVLKAGFVFMQMFSELDPTFLSFGKEFPCGQQLGITSYAEVMVKLWYLRTSVCDYSLYGGRWTFLNIYLSRLHIKINIFSNVCMIDVTISLFILFPDWFDLILCISLFKKKLHCFWKRLQIIRNFVQR